MKLRYLTANIFAAVVIVLVIIDPTRPMWQIVIPLALALGCTIVPRCMGWKPPTPRNSNGWQVLDCPSNSAHHVPTRRPAPGRIGKGATGS